MFLSCCSDIIYWAIKLPYYSFPFPNVCATFLEWSKCKLVTIRCNKVYVHVKFSRNCIIRFYQNVTSFCFMLTIDFGLLIWYNVIIQLTLPCCTWWCNYSSLLGIFLLCILHTTPWFSLLSLCLFSRVYSIIPQYELTTFYDLLLFCVWFYTIEKDKYVFLVSGSYFTECFPLYLLVFLISGVLEKSCFCAQWEMYNPPLFIISFTTTLAALLLQTAWSAYLCFSNIIFPIVCPANCVFPPFFLCLIF